MIDFRLQTALDARAEQDMPPIEWGVDPRTPIDGRRLKSLERMLVNHGSLWTKYEANRSALHLIPDRPGLYMFVWRIALGFAMASGPSQYFRQVLYVGRAGPEGNGTVLNRFKREYLNYLEGDFATLWSSRSSTRPERLGRLLLLREIEFWVCCQIDTELKLQDWESDLIKVFSPPGNVVHKAPKAKLGKPRAAF